MKNTLIIILISVFLALTYNWSLPEDQQFPLMKKAPEIVKGASLEDILMAADSLKSDPKAKEDYLNVSYEQVKMLMNDENVQLIDARPIEEYEVSRIGEAINIFPYEEENIYMEKILTELPREKKLYLIYCHGGTCDLSHMLADDMKAFDFSPIVIYTGGWEEWIKKEGIAG